MSSNDPALSLNLARKSRCLRADIYLARAAAATELEHYGDEEKFWHFVLIRGRHGRRLLESRVILARVKSEAK